MSSQPAVSNLTTVPPAYVGNADMIQPDLTPLQPSLDDFMEISGGMGPSSPGRADSKEGVRWMKKGDS